MVRYSIPSMRFNSSASFAVAEDGDDLVPDARGSLTPAQMVDAKFFALVGADSSKHREESCGSLHDRRAAHLEA